MPGGLTAKDCNNDNDNNAKLNMFRAITLEVQPLSEEDSAHIINAFESSHAHDSVCIMGVS